MSFPGKHDIAKVKISVLSQLFFPELISTGQLITELAEDLVDKGCSVTVLAGQPTYYESSHVPPEMEHRGIKILRMGNTQRDAWLSFFRLRRTYDYRINLKIKGLQRRGNGLPG